MREILFRGRDTHGVWQYGDYIRYDDEMCNITDTTIYRHAHLCYTETVGQYTGLTDKNGTKIFEGDIISILFEEDRSPWEKNCIYYENGEVYFCAEHHGWYVRFYDDDTLSLWEYDDIDIEVIGNIHDNPEL